MNMEKTVKSQEGRRGSTLPGRGEEMVWGQVERQMLVRFGAREEEQGLSVVPGAHWHREAGWMFTM